MQEQHELLPIARDSIRRAETWDIAWRWNTLFDDSVQDERHRNCSALFSACFCLI